MRLLLSLWASAVAVTHAATSSTGSATCDVGGPVTLTVSGTSGVVTDSTCTTSKTIAVTTLPKTNRTLAVAGYGIEQVRSVPDIDTLDLTYNHATTIADLSDYAKIKRLVLTSNNLKSTQLITWPSTLLQLDLSNNPLQPPLDLSSMRSLDQLVLTNTSLSDLSKVTFPTAITQLTASFNGMSKFPQSAAVSSLKTLTLNGNSIASFGDITIPPALESLDLSWNQISSFTGLKLPTTVKKLFLGGNKFTSLADLKTTNALTVLYVHDMSLGNLAGVSFPSTVTALSLMNCSLTTMSNVSLPSSLLYLDVSNNQLTALPTKYPDTLKSLTANTNSLTELSRITFPTSTTKLDFAGNKIAKVSGVSFPFVLEELYFGDFPVNEIEIKRSDLATIQKLKSLSLTVTQSACSNAAAQATTVNRTRFCVIPDDVFAKQYSSSTDVTSPSSSKGSGGWVLPVVIGAAVLAVIGLAVFIVRRRKAQHHHAAPKLPIGGADYSQTLANPSVFGDLPSFDNDHKNPMQQVTLNNMNSYSTMFTGSNGSNGSSGTESSLLKYRIPTHEITLKKAIAHGGFGAVYLALYQMQEVVVKKILPEKASDDRCLQAFLDEIKLCSTLNHPKVVRFIGVSWNTLSDIAVVLEYMAYGDLDTLLKQQAARHSTHPDEFGWYQSTNNLPCKSAIALDILDAVVYLHSFSSPIIHRDLKAKNVLLSQHYEAKLSDFGVSKEWRVDATMTAGIGTMAWIAPEVLRGERYTEKADIYSFGVILTELATCAKPFEGITNALIVLKVTSGEQRPDMGTNCPSDIKELGLRCLSYNPGDRPSAMVAHYELKTLLKAHTRFEL